MTSSTKTSEFNQTPFFLEPFLWSRLMGFEHLNREYRVGDFVEVRKKQDQLLRLDRLFYEKRSIHHIRAESSHGCIPRLCAVCTVFNRNVINNWTRFSEVVGTTETCNIHVSHIIRPMYVYKGDLDGAHEYTDDGHDCESDSHFVCRHTSIDGVLRPYVPRKFTFTYPDIENGEPFVFLNIFIDGFVSKDSRNTSSVGVYMRLSGTRSCYSHCSSFTKTVTLIPKGVSLDSVMKILVADRMCGLQDVCKAHSLADCTRCVGLPSIVKDVHKTSNIKYEVYDAAAGFFPNHDAVTNTVDGSSNQNYIV